ncbi:MAG TPA: hypothetical protein VI980_07105 [Acidimicrobiia bacterium]|nr:hypothetical protein [Acidimicrobiia bacterium]
MFLAHCDHLDRKVIIWTSSLDGIENTEKGIVVHYRCACGRPAEMLTGAGSPVKVSAHVEVGV